MLIERNLSPLHLQVEKISGEKSEQHAAVAAADKDKPRGRAKQEKNPDKKELFSEQDTDLTLEAETKEPEARLDLVV